MVDIICAFLSYIEFNKVDINHKCCISDWYGHDIAIFWNSSRIRTGILHVDEESARDALACQLIRSSIKCILKNDLYRIEKRSSSDSNGFKLSIRPILRRFFYRTETVFFFGGFCLLFCKRVFCFHRSLDTCKTEQKSV